MNHDPHVLALGYPKCGNVWLRALLADLLRAGGVDFRQIMENHPIAPVLEEMDLGIRDQARQDQVRFDPLRAYQDIPAVFSWAIPDIHAYAAATSMAHSHSPWMRGIDPFIGAFSHRVLIVRDPRAAAFPGDDFERKSLTRDGAFQWRNVASGHSRWLDVFLNSPCAPVRTKGGEHDVAGRDVQVRSVRHAFLERAVFCSRQNRGTPVLIVK